MCKKISSFTALQLHRGAVEEIEAIQLSSFLQHKLHQTHNYKTNIRFWQRCTAHLQHQVLEYFWDGHIYWINQSMVIYIGSIQSSFFTPHQHHQTHNYKTKIRSLRKESPPFPKKILMNSLINKISNQFVHTLLWLGLPKTPAPWLGLNPNFLLRCEIREMFGSPNADSFVGFGQFIEHQTIMRLREMWHPDQT